MADIVQDPRSRPDLPPIADLPQLQQAGAVRHPAHRLVLGCLPSPSWDTPLLATLIGVGGTVALLAT